MSSNDRRESQRAKHLLEVKIRMRESVSKKPLVFEGEAIEVGRFGLSISTDEILPTDNNKGLIEIQLPGSSKVAKARMVIQWRDDERKNYGIKFVNSLENQLEGWDQFVNTGTYFLHDRRSRANNRRAKTDFSEDLIGLEKRKKIRRISDLWNEQNQEQDRYAAVSKSSMIPKQKNDYTSEAAKEKRDWLRNKTGIKFHHIGVFSDDPRRFQGNIENFIGVAQVPIGIAGPLKINGHSANGDFYIPMATTEGALVYTYSIGMQVATISGGINTSLIKDETHISPLFTFENSHKSERFVQWLQNNFSLIKKIAEETTKYGKLLRLEPIIFDKNVTVKFCYKTGDAMGLNMINFATETACKFIVPIVKPKKYYLRSNFSSVKKISSHNFAAGMGKSVICDLIVPSKVVKRVFDVTPQDIVTYYNTVMLSSVHAGMISVNGHIANGMTAILIACGQDVANVVDSHLGITNFEVTSEGDLYASLKLPNLVIGTVGGGTDLGSQKECLELIGCAGTGKVEKFAEIMAATSLCGEISVCAAVAGGRFADAHRTYGRKQT